MIKRLIAVFLVIIISGCGKDEVQTKYYIDQGVMQFKQGNYPQAIATYQKALEEDPDNALVYNLLGMAYRFRFNQSGAQEFKEAEIDAFKKAVELDTKFVVAYKNLIASLYYQNRKKETIPFIKKVLELNPNHPDKPFLNNLLQEVKSATE